MPTRDNRRRSEDHRLSFTEKLSAGRAFFQDNGVFLSVGRLYGLPWRMIRNRSLASRLGIRSIDVGPYSFIRGLSSIQVGDNFRAGRGLWLQAIRKFRDQQFEPRIIIGENVSISDWSHIAAIHHVEVGDGALIGSNVLITDHNHGEYRGRGSHPGIPPSLRPLVGGGDTVIGKNVWIGDSVVVTASARIGEGTIIGANSVVIGQIPAYAVALGSPARVIKKFDVETEEWVPIG